MTHHRTAAVALALLAMLPAGLTAENAQQAFAKSWEGQSVTLRQVFYTLVYNERGRLGTTRNGRRDGLLVATPANEVYLQFDGRQGKDDVTARQPQQLVTAVNSTYEPDALEVRPYRKVEPVTINVYAAGYQLMISKVRIERDTVRVSFMQAAPLEGDDPATTLTIKWPSPFSKNFTERVMVEELLRRFVDVKTASVPE